MNNGIKKREVNSISKKQVIIGIAIFIICVSLTFFIVYINIKPKVLYETIKNFNKVYFIIGIFVMFLYSLLEGYNIKRLLKYINIDKSLLKCFRYAIIGFFFSGITPSSTGGQPMQIYYMYKKSIPPSYSSFVLFTMLFCYQIVIGIFGVIGYISQFQIISSNFQSFKIWFLVAILVNFIVVCFIGIILFNEKIASNIINIIVNFLSKINKKFATNINHKFKKFLYQYKECSKYLNNDNKIIFKIIQTAIIQYILFYSIPFLVYKGLGFSGFPIFTIITLQAVVYVGCSFIPTPGALAVTESLFVIMFHNVFSEDVIGNAMVISRSVSLYIPVLIYGLLCSFWLQALPFIKEKKYTKLN